MALESFRPTRLSETFQNSFLSLMAISLTLSKALQNLGVALQSQRAQENGAVEFAFAVNTNVQQILVVVLEFDPASTVRNDFAEEITLGRNPLKNTPGERCNCDTMTRSVPLMMKVPLSVISGISPKKTSCSLISRTVLTPVSALLIVNRQPDGHLEGRSVGHAALFAFGHVVFQLQTHRVAAAVAESDDILIERSAAVAEHVADMERIGLDGGAAVGLRQVERR